MDAAANKVLQGDFSWSRGFVPESDDDLFASYQGMIYEIKTDTDIEQLFQRQGSRLFEAKKNYMRLPLWWNDVAARLLSGVPVFENYHFLARIYKIKAPNPNWSPPGGRR
jgi:hypothetical protein